MDYQIYAICRKIVSSAVFKKTIRISIKIMHKGKIKEFFLNEVYGHLPSFEDVCVYYETVDCHENVLCGAVRKDLRVHLNRNGRFTSFGFDLFVPNNPKGVFVFLCNRPVGCISKKEIDPNRDLKSSFYPIEEILGRGYACTAFLTSEVAEDKNGFKYGLNSIFQDVDHSKEDSYGTLLMWAKGFSIVIDYLKQDELTKNLPIATVGHSRGGKTSLLAGALDERIDLVCSSCAGCSGDAEANNYHEGAETIKIITDAFPYWFAPNYRKYANKPMPYNQSDLLSLIAPRLLYTSSKSEDLWADPKGEFETLLKLNAAYEECKEKGFAPAKAFSIDEEMVSHEGNIAHHHLKGIHDLDERDWNLYMDFWDKKLQ